MKTIKLTIGYLGEKYNGWQVQRGQAHVKTVQSVVQSALKVLTNEDVKLTVAGRTDVGVNALGQVVGFNINSSIPANNFSMALNGVLPDDVVVYKAEEVSPSFNATKDAVGKWYRYTYYLNRFPHIFFNNTTTCIPYKLNLEAMKEAALYLEGTHDFKGFCAVGGYTKSFVRNIQKCKVVKKKSFVFIDIYANGFLYNMARILSGTLLKVGAGRMDPTDVTAIINSGNRRLAGATAPARGLCLMRVDYENKEDLFYNADYLDITEVFY